VLIIGERRDPPLIFDLGMHNGDDTHYYLAKGWDVLAVDANPDMCSKAQARFDNEIRDGRLLVLNLGVGLVEGHSTFYVNDAYDPISTFLPARFDEEPEGNLKWRPVEVQMTRLSSIMHVYGVPDYLKIDTEYHDEFALQDLAEMGLRPSYVSVEVKDRTTLERLLELDYDEFKVVLGETSGDGKSRWPIRRSDGTVVEYSFARYSSGPMADDLGGEWVNTKEMVKRVQASESSWLDVHARSAR
jgi:FkbM family methyltransferase